MKPSFYQRFIEFEDEIDLAFKINDEFLDDRLPSIDIVANYETISYLMTLFMSDFDYNPIYIQIDSEYELYCLRLFDDGNLKVFEIDKEKFMELSIPVYAHEIDLINYNYDIDSEITLFKYADEDYEFVHGDISNLD